MGELPRLKTTRGPMARPTYRGFRGDRLRELREERGCTQERLAVLVGAFPTMIGKWEREEVTPLAENVAKLAKELGVRPQDFGSIPPGEGSLVDLRVWSGRTRRQAAEAVGMSEHRLLSIEHLTTQPTPAIAQSLGDLYGVEPHMILSAWDRDRVAAFPKLAVRQ